MTFIDHIRASVACDEFVQIAPHIAVIRSGNRVCTVVVGDDGEALASVTGGGAHGSSTVEVTTTDDVDKMLRA